MEEQESPRDALDPIAVPSVQFRRGHHIGLGTFANAVGRSEVANFVRRPDDVTTTKVGIEDRSVFVAFIIIMST